MNTNRVACKGCDFGIKCCYSCPCWGTPEDINKIIDSGNAHKLSITADGAMLVPAVEGMEGKMVNLNIRGKCTFLTEDNLCGIHSIKPTEGAVVCCKSMLSTPEYRQEICKTWLNNNGKNTIAKYFLTMINYKNG